MKQMKGKYIQYVVKIDILSEVESYMTITEENRKLTELDYMAIENAIINLQYSFLSEFAQNEVRKKYQRDIIHNILNGLLSEDEMDMAASIIGLNEKNITELLISIRLQGMQKENTRKSSSMK